MNRKNCTKILEDLRGSVSAAAPGDGLARAKADVQLAGRLHGGGAGGDGA